MSKYTNILGNIFPKLYPKVSTPETPQKKLKVSFHQNKLEQDNVQ